MHIQILPGSFGKQISDFSVANSDGVAVLDLLKCLYESRFVVIKTHGISPRDYVSFARRLGDPIRLSRDPETPEIAVLTNLKVDSKQSRLGAAHWHTDQSFRKTVSSITMLYSECAPQVGGETKFCNMADAYDALDADTKAYIDDLQVEHQHGISVSAPATDHKPLPPPGWDRSYTVHHPLVRRHPETGRKTLYAVTGTAQGIRDMPRKAAIQLLTRLTEHVLQPQFVTSYRHELHDIVMWDNPTVMHSATPIAQATGTHDTRRLLRISLRGSPPALSSQIREDAVVV